MDNCLSLNGGAEFVARRGFGREIEPDEALDILARARETGLVQIADNVKSRPDLRVQLLRLLLRAAPGGLALGAARGEPERLRPRRDAARLRRVLALRARLPGRRDRRWIRSRSAGSRKASLAPRIDEERCVGCGVCAGACHKGALAMARGGRPRAVPGEHGREGGPDGARAEPARRAAVRRGGGARERFLHAAVDAILKLPPAQALLANEQVRSRFVKAALARFGA